MQKQILTELKEIKMVLAKLVGSADSAPELQFSTDALNKAAKQFQKLSIERGEWIKDDEIHKYIRKAPYRAGAFIRKEFGFTNYFKKGQEYYYSKKDLIALGNELKDRNVDLRRYMELIDDQTNFQKKLEALAHDKKQRRLKKPYDLPRDSKDISTSDVPLPSVEIVRQDLAMLKEQFFKNKFSDYIDIYKNNYAMMKFMYHFEKYIEPEMKKSCRKWCENFNYANHALKLLTKKPETFIPVQEEDMIQL